MDNAQTAAAKPPVLSDQRALAFVRAVMNYDPAASRVAKRLDSGLPLKKILRVGCWDTYSLIPEPVAEDTFRIIFGRTAKSVRASGSEWLVTYSGDTVVSAALYGRCDLTGPGASAQPTVQNG